MTMILKDHETETPPAESAADSAKTRKRGPNKPKPTSIPEMVAEWAESAIRSARKGSNPAYVRLGDAAASFDRMSIVVRVIDAERKGWPTPAEVKGAITAAEEDGRDGIAIALRSYWLPRALEIENDRLRSLAAESEG